MTFAKQVKSSNFIFETTTFTLLKSIFLTKTKQYSFIYIDKIHHSTSLKT